MDYIQHQGATNIEHFVLSFLGEQGPYIDGDKMTDADLSVSPKLLHARVALKYW